MIIVDTGFWLALSADADAHHARAVSFLETCQEGLITTWPVLAEACYLLLTRVSPQTQEAFVQSYQEGAFDVYDMGPKHIPIILKLLRKYRDLPMDLADASLVVLAEHLGHGRILSTDRRYFTTYRWKNHKPFTNLFLD